MKIKNPKRKKLILERDLLFMKKVVLEKMKEVQDFEATNRVDAERDIDLLRKSTGIIANLARIDLLLNTEPGSEEKVKDLHETMVDMIKEIEDK